MKATRLRKHGVQVDLYRESWGDHPLVVAGEELLAEVRELRDENRGLVAGGVDLMEKLGVADAEIERLEAAARKLVDELDGSQGFRHCDAVAHTLARELDDLLPPSNESTSDTKGGS